MTGKRKAWSDELIADLRSLAGKTSGQIAAELGVSRNAVIGACYRYGVKLPGIQRLPRDKTTLKATQRRSGPPIVRPPASSPETECWSLMPRHPWVPLVRPVRHQAPRSYQPEPIDGDLSPTAPFPRTRLDQCAWIPGDPRGPDVMCCGRQIELGQSYCQFHHRITQPRAR